MLQFEIQSCADANSTEFQTKDLNLLKDRHFSIGALWFDSLLSLYAFAIAKPCGAQTN